MVLVGVIEGLFDADAQGRTTGHAMVDLTGCTGTERDPPSVVESTNHLEREMFPGLKLTRSCGFFICLRPAKNEKKRAVM